MTPFRAPGQRGITPGGQGRFAGYDVLDQVDRWDAVTAGVVLSRLDPPAGFSFFTPTEQAAAGALLDLLLAQHDEPKVPVLALVDRRLATDDTDGWLYDGMPEDRDAWRFTLAALDHDASEKFGDTFCRLGLDEQATLIEAVHGAGAWHGLAAAHVWSLWTRYACAAFYAHPWAWNEIGFGGPAYPRATRPWESTNGSTGRSATAPTATPWRGETGSRRRAPPTSGRSVRALTSDE